MTNRQVAFLGSCFVYAVCTAAAWLTHKPSSITVEAFETMFTNALKNLEEPKSD